jgi:signal transduction histidine kinase
LQATADGVLVVDRSGRVAAFNRRLLELWDLADSQVAGASFAELVDLADQRLENAADCLRTLLRVEENRDLETFDSLRFLGGRFLERYSRPQKLGDDVVGRVWSYRDVTEREQLLRRTTVLADASRLLASLEVEPALVALAHGLVPAIASQCAVDLVVDGDVRRVSPGDGSDGPPAHPLALRGHSVAYDVDGSARIGAPLLVQGRPAGALTLVAHAQRSFAPADVQLVEEIARRASCAIENARLYESARAALVARDEFLAIASHEIRGPLSSIHLAAGFLGESPAATQRQREAVEIIKRQDRRLARFVNELVDVSRLQSGHVELSPEDVDVVDVIRVVVARFDTELLRSGSQLTVNASAPIVGLWDRGRLDQVVTSLLSNAIKFGAGAPIDIDAVDDDDTARITVRDRGIGIAPADQARVLELFERAVPARHYGGLGVGLFITRVLVEAMGGRVLVSSALGEGSTFTVEIPKRRGTR